MTLVPLTTSQPAKLEWRTTALRIGAAAFVVAISAGIIVGWDQVERLGVYGYPAVFLISLLSSATFLLPAPGVAFVLSMGTVLDPLLVGIIAGLGAALGELTAYLAGYYGNKMIQDNSTYVRVERWMKIASDPVIFLLAAVPNPFFDIGGLIAGVIRIRAWRFLLVTWIGKSLRFGLLAGAAALAF